MAVLQDRSDSKRSHRWRYCPDEMVLLLRVCILARDLGLLNLCAYAMDYLVRASFWDDFIHSAAVIEFAYSEACTVGQIRTIDC